MNREYSYTNIKEILSRIMRHPLLTDVTMEQAVQYTIDFIGTFGLPDIYMDKQVCIDIKDYRGKLPCDLSSIIQVKDNHTGTCMRSLTDTFAQADIEKGKRENRELAFKIQGSVIFTSLKEGTITVAYKALPIDEEGYPLLIDIPSFLKALEAYIKKEAFTILFDMGKINHNVLQNTQQQYSWLAGQLQSEFTIPSISEMESITRMWTSMIQKTSEFDEGFRSLGNREYLKQH